MLTQVTKISQLEVVEGALQIRLVLDVLAAGASVAQAYHRTLVPFPDGDVAAQMAAVNANLAQMGRNPVSEEDIERIQAVFDVAKQHF